MVFLNYFLICQVSNGIMLVLFLLFVSMFVCLFVLVVGSNCESTKLLKGYSDPVRVIPGRGEKADEEEGANRSGLGLRAGLTGN
jgi:hypothetical protein